MEKGAAKEDGSVLTPELADILWRERLQSGRSVSFRIASSSMHPLLSRGDRIMVKRIPSNDQPQLGDIVLFYTGGRWVVHRIVGRKNEDGRTFYRQKGDAEYRAAMTPASAVAGRVFMIEHRNGCTLLDAPLQKAVNRTIGYSFFLLDWMLRTGAGIFRHDQRGRGHIPAWHVIATICIKKTQSLLACAARLTGRFSSHP